MRSKAIFVIWGLFIVLALIVGIFQIKATVDCNSRGGVYVTNSGNGPVCLKAVTL